MMRTISNIRGSRRGAAMLAVIWLIAILGMACMAALRVIAFDMEVASAKVHGSRARQVAEMGIALGSNPAVKRSDPMLKQFNEGTGEGFEVRKISEGGRFNINYILAQEDKPLLKNIFTDWGMEPDQAQEVVDALADWTDADDNVALNGAEIGEYEKAGRVNQPFNRPFYDLGEMRLVRGMDLVEAIRPDWRDWFCLWSTGPLDVNDAPADLIAAAAECTVEQADAIPEQVRGPDGQRDTEDDSPCQNAAEALALLGIDTDSQPDLARRFTAETTNTTLRIESIGHAEGAKRKIIVVIRNPTGKPALLERTEEIIP